MHELPKHLENTEFCGILAPAGDQQQQAEKKKTLNATGGDALKFPPYCIVFLPQGVNDSTSAAVL